VLSTSSTARPRRNSTPLVRAAAYVAGAPISLLSLVDTGRQWFKANIGLPGVTETSRDAAFCAHTILQEEVLEVQDALRDPRFVDSPMVIGSPAIRFYAGAPIRLEDGSCVGSLFVIDRKPRKLTPSNSTSCDNSRRRRRRRWKGGGPSNSCARPRVRFTITHARRLDGSRESF